MAQWLGCCTSIAEDAGSAPGQGNKILQAAWHSQKKRIIKIKQSSGVLDNNCIIHLHEIIRKGKSVETEYYRLVLACGRGQVGMGINS